MHYDYFIAARYRNKEEALLLASRIRTLGKSVYCFAESDVSKKHVESFDANNDNAMKLFESIENWREDSRVREIFETDIEALRASDAIIVLCPVGKSGHIEAGVAYGLDKRMIQIGEQKETESLYLIFDEVYPTAEEFITTFAATL